MHVNNRDMKRDWPKIIVIFLLLFLIALPATAGAERDSGTGIIFPDVLAGAKLVKVMDYEKDNPGLGVGYHYGVNNFKVSVFIYNVGRPQIPSNTTSPIIIKMFDQARDDVYVLEKKGNYKDVALLIPQETVKIGKFPFLHAKMTYSEHNIKRTSQLYLTGFKNYFVKLRITYFTDDAINGEKSLDKFLSALGGLMIRAGAPEGH